jgi:hypothetical protein
MRFLLPSPVPDFEDGYSFPVKIYAGRQGGGPYFDQIGIFLGKLKYQLTPDMPEFFVKALDTGMHVIIIEERKQQTINQDYRKKYPGKTDLNGFRIFHF